MISNPDFDYDDDDFEIVNVTTGQRSNFDEIDEFINEPADDIKSTNSSLVEEEEEEDRSSPILNKPESKSRFFIPKIPSLSNLPSLEKIGIDPIFSIDEKFIEEIKNVSCLSSEASCLTSLKDTRNSSVYTDGRLILTDYRLLFVPSKNQTNLFQVDKRLDLFSNSDGIISIPICTILEIKASTTQSEKFKKLKFLFDTKEGFTIKEMLVKTKNFRLKSFVLSDKSCENFLHVLSGLTSQSIISNRFKSIKPKTNVSKVLYFDPKDLEQDLAESNVTEFMQVMTTVKFDNKFLVNSNIPFLAVPVKIKEVLARRVVVNEPNVVEFASKVKKTKKPGQTVQYQSPIIAPLIMINPFYNRSFPVWGYTDPTTACSLFTTPEAFNPENGDLLIKNLNTHLCDVKRTPRESIKVSGSGYSEYEFFKFQVPFTYHKIEISYSKLSSLCCYKSCEDYQNENGGFIKQLNSSKWLKHVSETLGLTNKIINSLGYHNVFIEEYRDHMDVACVLVSLVKICLNPKYRTIAGLDSLIQKEWFLSGHLFNKRLNDTEETGQISPIFLLFLDCLFQLTLQYGNEFEFNEFYLINLWDYSLTGLGAVFSFDGMSDFLDFVSTGNPKEVFEESNRFWTNHLEKNSKYFVNKTYKVKSDKKRGLLIPCDRIYMLKFWSRCYLRWVERYHAYNSYELDSDQVKQPPPLPPKPPKEEIKNDFDKMSDEEIIKLMNNGNLLATTRITSDGHIETSF